MLRLKQREKFLVKPGITRKRNFMNDCRREDNGTYKNVRCNNAAMSGLDCEA